MPPLVSRLRLTSRARRSHVGRSDALSGEPSPATSAGASSSWGRPSAARRATPRTASGMSGRSATARLHDRLGARAVGEQRLADPRLSREQGLALEELAQRVQVAGRLARERRPEGRRRGTPRR